MTGELPEGWVWTTVGEVAETTLGKMLDRAKNTGEHKVPYLRNVNVQWGRIDLDDVLSMEIPPDRQDFFRLREGDLLVCEGGEVGRCAIWPGGNSYMAFQKALHRVRPSQGVEAKFLLYLFEYLSITGKLLPYATGSTIKHIPQQNLRGVRFALPPSDEQNRIVTALEVQLSCLEKSNFSLIAASRRCERMQQASLQDDLRRTAVQFIDLTEVLSEKIINGRSVRTKEGGFPVLRLNAIRGGVVDAAVSKDGDWSEEEAKPFLIRSGDFLLSRGNGTLSLVGRGALVQDGVRLVAFPDTMMRIRVDSNLIESRYFSLVWNSHPVRKQIEALARTTAGIYKVNQDLLKKIKIPVPSLDDQQEIVRHAYEVSSGASRLRDSLAVARKHANQLRKALLTAAFTGKLVPQDSSDEPASLLLARIRAEGSSAPKPKRGRQADITETLARVSPATPMHFPDDPQPVHTGEQTALEF
ncbi:restriction endonuclease subunit S [Nocardiopsis sp. CNR-923]|uniref:restriction endonuclease subunit S n=1 Tax=Nocardiopsis sp. CNR-923 TaxID=1904965 RepID=UPI00096AAA28|nr:restriction endonuclease subunit S [Nocardiopsis sp. CNR-923]